MAAPLSPNATAILGYIQQLVDAEYAERIGPRGAVRIIEPMRVAMRALERELVAAARADGMSWSEIGEALGESKATVHRKWSHVG